MSRGRWLGLLALIALGVVLVVSRLGDKVITEVTLPLRHDNVIREQAARFDLDAALIAAVINAESGFADQTSSAGARGLMQITPDTADTIERLSGGETFTYDDLADPELNIRYGSYYLNYLLDLYDGNEVAALAAYNGGPGNVDVWGGAELEVEDIEFPETHAYVEQVLEKREQYRDNYTEDLGL